MLVQRLVQQSLRKFATQRPAAFSRIVTSKNVAPSTTVSLVQQQKRVASSSTTTQEPMTIDQGYDILVKQRLKRPVSPHLSIYRPQITWYGSGFNRITGCALSGAFYIFGFGYLVQPLLGYHIFESSSIIAAFAGMSLYAKVPLKFTTAFFFLYHSLNGFRHLSWDVGKLMKNQAVARTGWAVIAASAIGSAYLAVM